MSGAKILDAAAMRTPVKRQKWEWVGVAVSGGSEPRVWAVWQRIGGPRDGINNCIMPYNWLFPNTRRERYRINNNAQRILTENYNPEMLAGVPEKRELFW